MRRTLPLTLALLVGCSPGVLELDSPDAGSGGSSGTATTTSTVAPSAASGTGDAPCSGPTTDAGPEDAGTPLDPLFGPWTGYIENHQFPSGSDVLNLALAKQADGSPGGTLVFGMGTPPAPPTDPNVGYWPSAAGGGSGRGALVEGFQYSVHVLSFDGTRLRFGVEPYEVYKGWCDLQTTTYYSTAVTTPWLGGCPYGCAPDGYASPAPNMPGTATVTNPNGGQAVLIDFGKLSECTLYNVCSCWAAGCTVPLDQPQLHLDLQVTAGRLDGSILESSKSLGGGSLNGNYNVHFTSSSAEPSDR